MFKSGGIDCGPLAKGALGRSERFRRARGSEFVDSARRQLDDEGAGPPVERREESAADPRKQGKPIMLERVTAGAPRSGSAIDQNRTSSADDRAPDLRTFGKLIRRPR